MVTAQLCNAQWLASLHNPQLAMPAIHPPTSQKWSAWLLDDISLLASPHYPTGELEKTGNISSVISEQLSVVSQHSFSHTISRAVAEQLLGFIPHSVTSVLIDKTIVIHQYFCSVLTYRPLILYLCLVQKYNTTVLTYYPLHCYLCLVQ